MMGVVLALPPASAEALQGKDRHGVSGLTLPRNWCQSRCACLQGISHHTHPDRQQHQLSCGTLPQSRGLPSAWHSNPAAAAYACCCNIISSVRGSTQLPCLHLPLRAQHSAAAS